MEAIKYFKMNGLGNRFNIFDLRNSHELSFAEIKTLSKKNDIAESYDQLILLLNSNSSDVNMKIYNIDGSEAEACGNASRCVAKILIEDLGQSEISIKTTNRVLHAYAEGDEFKVNMGEVKTQKSLPNLLDSNKFKGGFQENLGNPHIVFFVDDLDSVDLKNEVSHLEKNFKIFPEGVNINVAQIISDCEIKLKTWERGAGSTLACGTGACATAFAAFENNFCTTNQIKTIMPLGFLKIEIMGNQVSMQGDANLEDQKNILLAE
jgi:diaminopimelate epimerase